MKRAEGNSEKAGGEGVLRREGASFTFITGGAQGGGAGAGRRRSQCWADERLYVTASQCPTKYIIKPFARVDFEDREELRQSPS